eukprot:1142461-Pelagomonas_calceolata.AAC.1
MAFFVLIILGQGLDSMVMECSCKSESTYFRSAEFTESLSFNLFVDNAGYRLQEKEGLQSQRLTASLLIKKQ